MWLPFLRRRIDICLFYSVLLASHCSFAVVLISVKVAAAASDMYGYLSVKFFVPVNSSDRNSMLTTFLCALVRLGC